MEWRRTLQDFCKNHGPSVAEFRSNESFRKLHTDPDIPVGELKNLTTTATCIQSLLKCGDGVDNDVRHLGQLFSARALERPAKRWTSEGAAGIYARCRALPLALLFLDADNPKVDPHLATVFAQMDFDGREAIGEVEVDSKKPSKIVDSWPPNAFHTFWALELISNYGDWAKRCGHEINPKAAKSLARRKPLLAWARRQVASQVVLHHARSADLDSDQLAWALAILARFAADDRGATPQMRQNLFEVGLSCLFGTQEANGTWRRYRPLFNFQRSGNAYCYVYETFDVLLGSVVGSGQPSLLNAFIPYVPRLMLLFGHAMATRVPLTDRAFAWASGNTTNRTQPEGWATASVFAFAQSLRVLLGVWTREAALRGFRYTPSPELDEKQEIKQWRKLATRGDNWRTSEAPSVAEMLATLFINPARMSSTRPDPDPDMPAIADEHPRSAILFGPPGASKTTLVETVARLLGWEFIEIHSSDFLADGLQNVHRTADGIFRRLMQLDRCVVLFDEIDELVREREGGSDAFGRFLTTGMLPKLAELWKRRGLLYFLATNHIGSFDAAIIRAERFDALLFVSPPSFGKKSSELLELLRQLSGDEWKIELRQQHFDEALERAAKSAAETMKEKNNAFVFREHERIAQFPLLRWDQLPELALRLIAKAEPRKRTIDEQLLQAALEAMKDKRLANPDAFVSFVNDSKQDRRDFRQFPCWEVCGVDEGIVPSARLRHVRDRWWLVPREDLVAEHREGGFSFVKDPDLPGHLGLANLLTDRPASP